MAAVHAAIGDVTTSSLTPSTTALNGGSIKYVKWNHVVMVAGSINPKTSLTLNTDYQVTSGLPKPVYGGDINIMYRGANNYTHRSYLSLTSGGKINFQPRFENIDDWLNFQITYITNE